jgi:predicted  nucleic acid-binding Zn-ribbon protein
MWEAEVRSLVLQRNLHESLAYFPVYNAFQAIERKNRALKKKHIEIRNSIGVLQYEIQESIYQKNSNLEEVKQKLSSIAEDLSPRTKKDFDDIKLRFELSRKIREQDFLIQDLKSESETAKSQLSELLESVVRLQEEIQRKDAVNQTLIQELEGTRACLSSAEARLRTVEAENIQYAQRIVDEKNRTAQQLNEMNKLIAPVANVPDILGEGFNLMKKFGTGTLFARPAEKPQLQVHEHEIEDDFVDVKTSGIKKGSVDSNKGDEPFYNDDCLPPRKPLFYVKCHTSEVNDIAYNKSFVMTGGSDSTVKIFEKGGSGESLELSVGEYDELPPQDARNTLLVGGPVISLDLKGDWLAAGCCDRIGRIWSVRTGRLRHNLSGHSNKVNSIRLVGQYFSSSLQRKS